MLHQLAKMEQPLSLQGTPSKGVDVWLQPASQWWTGVCYSNGVLQQECEMTAATGVNHNASFLSILLQGFKLSWERWYHVHPWSAPEGALRNTINSSRATIHKAPTTGKFIFPCTGCSAPFSQELLTSFSSFGPISCEISSVSFIHVTKQYVHTAAGISS